MSLPLTGRRLLLTRPRGQAERLGRLLGEQGATVLQFPVTDILPLDDVSGLRALAARLDEFTLAFFVSPNAVAQCFAVLAVKQWPARLRVATVGAASARALQAQGFDEVIYPRERFDSEGVLALPEFQSEAVAGQKILILRGDGGRDLLAQTLVQRGAQIEYVQCYQRRCAKLDPSFLAAQSAALSGVVFSNSEAIRHFGQILGQGATSLLAAVPVFAPHPRIVAEAERAGARQVVLTAAGDEGIVAGIVGRLADV